MSSKRDSTEYSVPADAAEKVAADAAEKVAADAAANAANAADAANAPGDEADLEVDLLPPEDGAGRLLQRDYWAIIGDCTHSPREVAALVQKSFWEFPPPELVKFSRVDGTGAPLEPGDEMDVEIRMAGTFRVRVLHRDDNSITIGTIKGHPEAGRITFGAYRNARKDVIFHIRSMARSGSRMTLLGFKALGEAMQTNTWTDFIKKVAVATGRGVLGEIRADTKECDDAELGDDNVSPTFIAQGD
jgi:hypothetical protein